MTGKIASMANGMYSTEVRKHLEGPALITYVYGRSLPIIGKFEQGAQKIDVLIAPGLFIPRGVSVTFDREGIVTWVVPNEHAGQR